MKNSWQKGETLTLTAPYAVASGDGFKVGLIFAIASSAAAISTPVEGQTTGVCDVLAVTADTAAGPGVAIYWDDTAKKATTTVGSNIKIGVTAAAKTGSETTVRVRLNGVF